jgi:uncharacterized protein (TIGR02996 family)
MAGTISAVRRFEHPSGKFWSIDEDTASLYVRWGLAGQPGQKRDIAIPSFSERRDKLRELVAKQVALGYVEKVDTEELIKQISEGKRWYQLFEHDDGRSLAIAVDWKSCFEWRDGSREAFEHRRESFAAAVDEARRLITLAINEGMKISEQPEPIVERDPDFAGMVVSNPELEAQCRAAPDDPAPWSVYADWLMTQSDPRGEIAALRIQGKEDAADALFASAKAQLFGAAIEDDDEYDEDEELNFAEAIDITSWRHGFPRGAVIKLEMDDALSLAQVTERFARLPLATFVEELRFGLAGWESNNDWEPTLEAVAKSSLASTIRVLRFDDFTYEDQEISWAGYGDFSKALPRLTALEELRIRSGQGGTLGTIVMPSMKKFVRVSGGLAAREISSIVEATWPELEFLEIWFGRHQYQAEGNAAMLAPIFAARGLAKLRHLGIVNCEFSESAIQALLDSKLLRQLTSLDLSKGIIAHREIALVTANADKLRHLTAIDVSDNFIDGAQLRALQAVLPNVVSTEQREFETDDDDDDGGDSRYAALGE